MKAEIARESARFGECLDLMSGVPEPEETTFRMIVDGIKSRSEKGDPALFSVEDKPKSHSRPQLTPKPKKYREFAHGLSCPNCESRAKIYRDFDDALVCPNCARSFEVS